MEARGLLHAYLYIVYYCFDYLIYIIHDYLVIFYCLWLDLNNSKSPFRQMKNKEKAFKYNIGFCKIIPFF